VPDPRPISLPRDDAPHDRLTEWWYYTGHLRTVDGHRFGFEYVIFRAERGGFPVTWASHVAITDETGDAFHYAQRTEIGPQVNRASGGLAGFDLAIDDASRAETAAWSMVGHDGEDEIAVALSGEEAAAAGSADGLGLDLRLRSTKPAALHNGTGWIDFGAGGSSYYYSRTSMEATGSVVVGGATLKVDGIAWFDHQWGDFITVGGGGWDWFALNLDDGRDLTLSLVRDGDGSYPLVYGTLVTADGTARNLPREAFTVEVTRRWTSPTTGADYPAGWTITIPGEHLVVDLTPTVAGQELDTRATTGVVYWEGSQRVSGTRVGVDGIGVPVGGEAYVELTGYAPAR
jgi:predicted secreted hydrolase